MKRLSFVRTSFLAVLVSLTLKMVASAPGTGTNPVVQTVSGADSVTITVADNSTMIADSKSLFKAYIDPDFFDLPIEKNTTAPKQITAQVLELKEMVNLSQLFKSFGKDLDKLCFTQSQIVQFCKTNAHLLSDPSTIGGSETFFLFKAGGVYYVAGVGRFSNGPNVLMHRITETGILLPQLNHRVVIPN